MQHTHLSLYARGNTPTLQPVRGLSEAVSVDDTTYDLRAPSRRHERDSVRAWHETHETCVAHYLLAPFQRPLAGANSIPSIHAA